MDSEYLQNIAGSPHIDEGLGSRILSRGASGLQRLSGMTGGQFTDLNHTKVESLFNSFLRKITPTLADFADGEHSVANRLEQMRPQLTPQHEAAIQELRDLYNTIVPNIFTRNQIQNSVLQPRDSRTQLSTMVKEGIFTRDMALNSALQSNDATTIINAYANTIKREFGNFVRDAMKITGAPKDYIKKILGNLNQKWSPVFTKLDTISNTPPVVPAQSQQNGQQAAPTAAQTTNPSTQANATPQNTANGSKDDFVNIVGRVMDIIIATVSTDMERAEKFISNDPTKQKELPKDWDQPPITKESITEADEEEQGAEEPKGEDEIVPSDDEESESPDEFLYNFHSRYDKQRTFSIDVTPPNKNLNLIKVKGGKETKELNVIWNNRRHENNIYVKYFPVKIEAGAEGEETTTPLANPDHVLLFKFYDDQVNPRNNQGKFNVGLLLEQANPLSKRLFDSADSKAQSTVLAKQQAFQRALYATTHRKTMEFKRKLIPLKYDEEGNVFRFKKNGKEVITKAQLIGFLTSKDPKERDRWKKSLDRIHYFDKFPDPTATNPETPDNPDQKGKIKIEDIPAAFDAFKAIRKLGKGKTAMSFQDATAAIKAAIEKLGDKASVQDYIKAALEQPKEPETTQNVSTEPSKPAGEEPTGTQTSAPVSAPVSTEPTNPVSAPVSEPASEKKPEPEKAPSEPGEKELGKASWDDNGIVTWNKPDGKTVSKLTPARLKNMKSPRLELLLQKNGYYEKFPQAKSGKLNEDFINPFDLSNFL